MKRSCMVIALVALLSSLTAPLFAQASTEGKEFWVALAISNAPNGKISNFEPFIAISAKKACQVTVSNPATGWTDQPRNLTADSWTVINNIPTAQWYDLSWTANSASENVDNKGIYIKSTEDISVFAAMRMEYSYDATNVLPQGVLQSEYILQDYPPYNQAGEAHSTFVIVATEDNTTIDITPSTPTIKGKAANTTFSISLNKGQTYQVVSTDKQTFSGTRVKAKNGKKIAVFSGADFTQIPGGKSARDCLYEQAMPIDYWGTEFVVTRSMEKDANRIRITAQEDGTSINIDGHFIKNINSGETYEFEMSENLGSTEMAKYITGAGREIPDIFVGDAHYIQTSCPCAVYGYDVSSAYLFKANEANKKGDPSMVWISPLQQRISKITFGACGTAGSTGHTNKHYVNIVCLTSDVASFQLSSDQRANIPATFTPVPGNPTYSYARVFLVDTDGSNPDKVYTMSNKTGFVAHVYGSGNNESYAYSVGSSAVKRGVAVDGENYTEGYISETVYCIGTPISFDAQVGTDVIDKVDWDFGDGVSEQGSTPQTTHTYDSPGWYDIVANIYAHKECPYSQYPAEEVRFSFRVRRPDTISVVVRGDCLAWDDTQSPIQEIDSVQPDNCATDNFEIRTIVHGRDTRDVLDTTITARDQFFVPEENKWYYATSFPQGKGIVEGETTYTNSDGCTHTHAYKYNLTIITCLEMDVPNNPNRSYICPDDAEAMYNIPFHYVKGQIAEAYLLLGDKQLPLLPLIDAQDTVLQVPTESLIPGSYDAKVVVRDEVCDQLLTFDYSLLVYYPSNIFKLKFGNVLAVYTPAFNGGYTFTGYQWYKDGQPIEGATSSVYHTEEPFPAGSSYYVVLSRPDGVILPSCEQVIPATDANSGANNNGANTNNGAGNNGANANSGNNGANNAPQNADNADYNASQQAPAAEKVMRGNSLYIRLGNTLYDIYGNHIE